MQAACSEDTEKIKTYYIPLHRSRKKVMNNINDHPSTEEKDLAHPSDCFEV